MSFKIVCENLLQDPGDHTYFLLSYVKSLLTPAVMSSTPHNVQDKYNFVQLNEVKFTRSVRDSTNQRQTNACFAFKKESVCCLLLV